MAHLLRPSTLPYDGLPPALAQWVIDGLPAGHDLRISNGAGDWTIPTRPPSSDEMARAVEWVSSRFLGRYGVNVVADAWDPPRVEVRTTGDALALALELPAKVGGIAVSVRRGAQVRPYWGSKRDPMPPGPTRRPRATLPDMYAPVSAMRSNRYPLAGLGCGCAPTSGLGQIMAAASGLATGLGIAGTGFVGLIAGYFIGKHAQRTGLALNRRRRSRRSRR